MRETDEAGQGADLAHRRERGIGVYARIFDVPEQNVPAAMACRVGPVFAEEAFLAAGGPATLVTNYIGQARGSLAMEAVQRVAGSASPGSGPVGP